MRTSTTNPSTAPEVEMVMAIVAADELVKFPTRAVADAVPALEVTVIAETA